VVEYVPAGDNSGIEVRTDLEIIHNLLVLEHEVQRAHRIAPVKKLPLLMQ